MPVRPRKNHCASSEALQFLFVGVGVEGVALSAPVVDDGFDLVVGGEGALDAARIHLVAD